MYMTLFLSLIFVIGSFIRQWDRGDDILAHLFRLFIDIMS